MPVLVTAADHQVGDAVVRRLLRLGGQVRAFCVGGDEAVSGPGELRRAGAIVASGDLDDEGHLETAMAQVHTVVHAVDGLTALDDDAHARAGTTVVTAATRAGVARLVVLSTHGAGVVEDPLREAAGVVERACEASPVPTIVVRTSLVDRPPVRDLVAQAPPATLDPTTPVAPVAVAALADLLVAIDDVRGGEGGRGGHLRLAADGHPTTLGAWRDAIGATGEGGMVGRVWRPDAGRRLVLRGIAGPWTLASADPRVPVDEAWPLFDLPTPS